jgi:hypothetical protein
MDNLWIVVTASLLSGLIGVIVTLTVQKYTAKRTEKMFLFKTLMSLRFVGVSHEKTRALNLIEVIFYDAADVISAWRTLYDSFAKQDAEYSEIQDNTLLLLTAMAKHLNYKNLDWSIIKKSYLPIGISSEMQNEAEFKENMNDFLKMVKSSGGPILQNLQQGYSGQSNSQKPKQGAKSQK